jgi:beta-galactosidase
MWRVKFEPGTLKAVSRKDGKEIMTRVVRTAGKPARLILNPDRKILRADGKDLSFVTVEVVDEAGNIVPYADNLISFEASGNGLIEGVDNGDPVSHESFKANQRKAFHGLCLVVVKGSDKKGIINLKASAEGLESTSVTIELK